MSSKTCRKVFLVDRHQVCPAWSLWVTIIDEPSDDDFTWILPFAIVEGLEDRASPATVLLDSLLVCAAIRTSCTKLAWCSQILLVVNRCLFQKRAPFKGLECCGLRHFLQRLDSFSVLNENESNRDCIMLRDKSFCCKKWTRMKFRLLLYVHLPVRLGHALERWEHFHRPLDAFIPVNTSQWCEGSCEQHWLQLKLVWQTNFLQPQMSLLNFSPLLSYYQFSSCLLQNNNLLNYS